MKTHINDSNTRDPFFDYPTTKQSRLPIREDATREIIRLGT